jgi:hypothetical protein
MITTKTSSITMNKNINFSNFHENKFNYLWFSQEVLKTLVSNQYHEDADELREIVLKNWENEGASLSDVNLINKLSHLYNDKFIFWSQCVLTMSKLKFIQGIMIGCLSSFLGSVMIHLIRNYFGV